MSQLKSKYENHSVLGPHLDLLTRETGSDLTSKKHYRPIKTLDVVDFYVNQGFVVESLHKSMPVKTENQGFEKHKVTLRMPEHLDFKIEGLKPKLHIINSYNAQQSLKFYLGVYRMVCSNGLVVGDGLFHNTIRHIGDVDYKLNQSLNESRTAIERVQKSIESWSTIYLSNTHQISLAKRLLNLRLPKSGEFKTIFLPPEGIKRALKIKREADSNADLFTVFNRIQEHLIERPDVTYYVETTDKNTGIKTFQTRRLSNIRPLSQVALNAKLWQETEGFLTELKGG